MADNPKSLASLADELEELFSEYGQARGEYESARERLERDTSAADCRKIKTRFLAAAAALRATTIAADEPKNPSISEKHYAFHETVPLRVIVDVDKGIADAVTWLNTLDGVRTFGCCQGGKTYEPYVTAWWPDKWESEILARFAIENQGDGWAEIVPHENASWEPLATPSQTIAAVTDDDVKDALSEYDDASEYNTRETNMRAALENFVYRKSAQCEHVWSPLNYRCVQCGSPKPSKLTNEIADAYRDARLENLRGLATELERRLANVIALSENVVRGQVWPHSGNSFAQAIADAARGKQEAAPSPTIAPTSRSSYESDCCRAAYDVGRDDRPTIAAPSPSNEVNDEMVDAVIIGLGLEEDIGDALAREDVKRVLEAEALSQRDDTK